MSGGRQRALDAASSLLQSLGIPSDGASSVEFAIATDDAGSLSVRFAPAAMADPKRRTREDAARDDVIEAARVWRAGGAGSVRVLRWAVDNLAAIEGRS